MSKVIFKYILFLSFLISNASIYGQIDSDRFEVLEYQELETKKSLVKNGDKEALQNYNQLLKCADELLDSKPFSVVHKTGMPPSKDKHDYISIGPYWWPNPDTDDGLPYIRKDGEINPEARNNHTDFVEMRDFLRAIKQLTEAYYLSDKEIYAIRAIDLIKIWFLDAETRMNPNLDYSQSIPGKNDGRCFGIIELDGITDVIKFLELAKDRNLLDVKTEEGMSDWLIAYSDWLKNSELGHEESTRKNNHGTHYDVQLLSILLYLNKKDEVRDYLNSITKARIISQIEPDGSQPLELARTKSFSYSVMNLHGFLELAQIGEKVGVNLWEFESKDGRSIKKGYQFMVPFLIGEKQWEHKQIKDRKSSEKKLLADLVTVKKWFNDTSFDEVLKRVQLNKQ
ncbi:probable exported protein YPO3473 [Nonlabens tegetincola]|uniref:Probable exported protein YPO3473 n=1 Tax=Nonlabens tegetincola TaxID=323273 RepID=A0A090Q8G5_9FLAO|nr:alginate lyase family protein [Nonlabens tegetincola]GAK98023.1 probable exported protein YPO3473 [Nonlabens tegetincola]